MKEASVIYGVTMRGDGVSELLSIKLEGAEKYAE
jgi:chromosome segregation ATPase